VVRNLRLDVVVLMCQRKTSPGWRAVTFGVMYPCSYDSGAEAISTRLVEKSAPCRKNNAQPISRPLQRSESARGSGINGIRAGFHVGIPGPIIHRSKVVHDPENGDLEAPGTWIGPYQLAKFLAKVAWAWSIAPSSISRSAGVLRSRSSSQAWIAGK